MRRLTKSFASDTGASRILFDNSASALPRFPLRDSERYSNPRLDQLSRFVAGILRDERPACRRGVPKLPLLRVDYSSPGIYRSADVDPAPPNTLRRIPAGPRKIRRTVIHARVSERANGIPRSAISGTEAITFVTFGI